MISDHSIEYAKLIQKAEAAAEKNRWQTASDIYFKALASFPLRADLWHRAGICLKNSGKINEALHYLEKASMLAPGTIEFELERGDILFNLGRFEEAVEAYHCILATDPENISALNNIGVTLQEAGKIDEAINTLNETNRLAPDDPMVQSNYAAALIKANRPDEALPLLESATRRNPNYAKSWSNLALTYEASLRLDKALNAHARAVSLEPQNASIHYNRAMTYLLLGDFAEGFRSFEFRRYLADRKPRKFAIPEWTSEPLDGAHILVHAEQGIGDTIQFARFIPLLENLGAQVSVSVHQSLNKLAKWFSGTATVLEETPNPKDFDYQIALLSLPFRLNLTLADVEMEKPYLSIPANEKVLRERSQPSVGVVWSGNPRHTNDINRSIPAKMLLPLLSLPNFTWVNLQQGERANDLVDCSQHALENPPRFINFADTAKAISELDLIISVDTSVAHLAGALGIPVWILLPYLPDWRWLLDRNDSPWYSQARLFRQKTPNSWDPVIAEVKEAITQRKFHLGKAASSISG
tara:strand:+ start:177 stop:1754 length:1578 start_codon:yes stop_codon:yes gene_type:complete